MHAHVRAPSLLPSLALRACVARPDSRAGALLVFSRLWLASDFSDYIVGSTIYIDGGMTLYPGFEDDERSARVGARVARSTRPTIYSPASRVSASPKRSCWTSMPSMIRR